MRVGIALLAAGIGAASLCAAQGPGVNSAGRSATGPATAPEAIFYRGVIYTGIGLSEDKPQTASAMAIGGGKVLAVGTDDAVLKLAGPKTRIVNLSAAGKQVFVFPGFNDAHTRLGEAARVRLDLDRPLTPEERRRGDELAIADAVSHGVTSVQDFSDWQDFLVFEQMEKVGKLNLRITEWLPFQASLEELKRMRDHHDRGDKMLHTGMLKGFMDGSLVSRTAALKTPYADEPGNSGLPQLKQAELNIMAEERVRAGFQLGFDAIGDRAVAMALDAIEHAERVFYHVDDLPQTGGLMGAGPCRLAGQPYEIWDEKMPCGNQNPSSGSGERSGSPPGLALFLGMVQVGPRNRIEHAEVVDPADIPRFKHLSVIASMQPSHLLTDMNWAEARLGPKRAVYSYAWKAFLDAGVPLAFGTDYPVEPITPFRGLYAAVTRMNEAGTKSYFPEQKINRGEALYAYTQGSAYAEFAEQQKGKLEPGFDADFIVVDRDLDTVPAAKLLGAKVLETFVAGRQVFLANVRIR